MDTTLQVMQLLGLAIILFLPMLVVSVVAVVRWARDHDRARLGDRLRRWNLWACLGTYAVLALAFSASTANPTFYSPPTGVITVLIVTVLPLGAWLWARRGGRSILVGMWAATAATVAFSVFVLVDAPWWWDIQNGRYPFASFAVVALGASVAIVSHYHHVQGAWALIAVGLVPVLLDMLVAPALSAVATETMQAVFAPMPLYAVLGVLTLIGQRLARPSAGRPTEPPPTEAGRTMAA